MKKSPFTHYRVVYGVLKRTLCVVQLFVQHRHSSSIGADHFLRCESAVCKRLGRCCHSNIETNKLIVEIVPKLENIRCSALKPQKCRVDYYKKESLPATRVCVGEIFYEQNVM